jgi:hypothetical protein
MSINVSKCNTYKMSESKFVTRANERYADNSDYEPSTKREP